MKTLKYIFFIIISTVIISAFWIYYPHYQIQKLQDETREVGRDMSSETYLDYYRQFDKGEINHLALGDSVIHGFGVEETENLVYKFSDQLGQEINKTVHYINEGKNGITSTSLNEMIQKGAFNDQIKKADIITVNIGGNDVLKTAKQKDYSKAINSFDTLQSIFTKNLADITKKINEINPRATIVFLELYNPLPADHQFSDLADTLLPKWNVKIYEVAQTIPTSIVVQTTKVINSKNPQHLSEDGVHPNSAGYAAITEQMMIQFSKEYRKQAV
ncbi:GDSL-type esterase/lipase family protein [Mesobacillus maritimus]|uniref:GDSL-type esterase/lipase family protein n=1 Tax=Mesobacillus maritimus TaxID=1643336 RepID=UPI00203B0F68|nr:GDSL-type esterase/lipase family protein [Mesobacillus maritimus]MCM3584193.1 GDSL-type esterase/lipase family protein [Mesobacillus maritimus]MCM3669345.1 GDSL-type esterase/lipase family protein [Mesobacillus maritimus]